MVLYFVYECPLTRKSKTEGDKLRGRVDKESYSTECFTDICQFANDGSNLSSSQFLLLPQQTQRTKLDLK